MLWSSHEQDALLELILAHAVMRGEFELSSGQTSSIYCDVKQVSLRPEGAWLVGRGLLELALRAEPELVAVGGLTLGADPLVTAISMASYLAMRPVSAMIVRKQAKGHGTTRAIEAPKTLATGSRVVAVDDVITTGGATLKAIESLRESGFIVEHAVCVVDRLAEGKARLAERGVTLHSIFTLNDLEL